MKNKKKHKRITLVTKTQRSASKSSWTVAKQVLVICAPCLFADMIAAIELENGALLPGWLWGLGVLTIASWLYTYTAKTLLLDMKGGVMVTFYPLLLRQWSQKVKLTSMMRGLLLFAPLLAVMRTMTHDRHTGFTLFASVYLGFALFALLVTVGRRRVRIRWLQNIAEDTAVHQIKSIDTLEEIEEPGWYVLAKYPSWAIRVTKVESGYGAEVQVETIPGWNPVCNRNERPKRMKRIHQLVRELQKIEAEWDAELDETLVQKGISV